MDDEIPVESGRDYRVLAQGILGFYMMYRTRARRAEYHVFSYSFVCRGECAMHLSIFSNIWLQRSESGTLVV